MAARAGLSTALTDAGFESEEIPEQYVRNGLFTPTRLSNPRGAQLGNLLEGPSSDRSTLQNLSFRASAKVLDGLPATLPLSQLPWVYRMPEKTKSFWWRGPGRPLFAKRGFPGNSH